jgi:hypothetical protein
VTIAVGCLCEDGLILGADTQLTAVGYHKSYGRKIFAIDNDGSVDACIAYAGSPVFASDFTESLQAKLFEVGDSADIGDARNMVVGVLSRYVESDVHSNHMLIGVRIRGPVDMVALMRTSGYSVSLQSSGHPVFVGAGDSSALALALPLASRYGVQGIEHGAVLATLIIEIAKKYVDGCGGDTDILMVPSIGEIEFLDSSTGLALESEISDITHTLSSALSAVLLRECEEEELHRVIEKVVEELKLSSSMLKHTFNMRDLQKSKN